MSSTTITRDALSPDKKACLVFDISNEALVSPNRNTKNGHAECRKYTLRSHISSFCSEN